MLPPKTISDGTFLLDSADCPSFIKQSTKISKYLTQPILIRTSNGIFHSEESCHQIHRLRRGQKIHIISFTVPGISKNLLSMAKVAQSRGSVIFSKTVAYCSPPAV